MTSLATIVNRCQKTSVKARCLKAKAQWLAGLERSITMSWLAFIADVDTSPRNLDAGID